ncbi:MAG: Ig-like domain-containing protein [Gemmatimonadetes bacterium]|nr:Ig-like domain-containing protein [Gemmatimonadota bacterium]
MQSDLVAATASTDDIPPTSSFDPPSAPDAESGVMTISGTASDAGGGVVAAVEVSLDGGMTWRPARGRTNWSYAWDPGTTGGEVSILSRAVDDSGNLETPGATTAAAGGEG